MATSIAIIILLAIVSNFIFEKIKLPGLLGMLILGITIGPYGFNLIHGDLLNISSDLRKIALIVILLRAGMGIKISDLKKIGKPAIKMSCIPGILEGFFIAFISTKLLGFTFIQGGILGFIIAAVSPAVVVPQMINLIDNKIGTNKSIPTLILAGASIDDVFAITILTSFLALYSGKNINIASQLLQIPLSIILGIVLGLILGFVIIYLFKKCSINDVKKILIMLAISILLTTLETIFKDKLLIASLLGVMTIGFVLTEKLPNVATPLSQGLNKLWIFAEILLFVLVGAQVNISVAFTSGAIGIIIIFIGLVGRSIGVIISLIGTNLNVKERIFCVISYIPKATVQAAMGALPLSLGVVSGDLILAISVLSILVTAPLGAIGIKVSSKSLLHVEN
ncbi:potassium transporter [Clostridium sulfidigenes]|uniref:Potassium transporter n=1 Tax=Clostridium sulfidigenes TaxID=318464 RepID=A0A084JBX3_9CLOT|nr:cation:proton antiporter [Clostridium sulfidigenes]KEZ86457.1 potassium transporter [Clostridium sulfidigenes]